MYFLRKYYLVLNLKIKLYLKFQLLIDIKIYYQVEIIIMLLYFLICLKININIINNLSKFST